VATVARPALDGSPVPVMCSLTDVAQPVSQTPGADVPADTQTKGGGKQSCITKSASDGVAQPSGMDVAAGKSDPEPVAEPRRKTGRAQQKRTNRGASEHAGLSGTTGADCSVQGVPEAAVSEATLCPAPLPAPEVDADNPVAHTNEDGACGGAGAEERSVMEERPLAIEEPLASPEAVPKAPGRTGRSQRIHTSNSANNPCALASGASEAEVDGDFLPDAQPISGRPARQGSNPFQSPAHRKQEPPTPRSALKRRKQDPDMPVHVLSQSRGCEGPGLLNTRRVSFSVAEADYCSDPQARKGVCMEEVSDPGAGLRETRIACQAATPVVRASLISGMDQGAEVLEGAAVPAVASPNMGPERAATMPPALPSVGRTTGNSAPRPADDVHRKSMSNELASFNSGLEPSRAAFEAMSADGRGAQPSGGDPAKGTGDAVPSARTTSLATDSEEFHSTREATTPASNADYVTPGTDLLHSRQSQPQGNPSTGRGYSTRRNPGYLSTLSAEQAVTAVKVGLLHKTPEQANSAPAGNDRIQNITVPPPPAFIPLTKSRSSNRDQCMAEASVGDAKENAADVNVLGKSGEGGTAMGSPTGVERCTGEGPEGVMGQGQRPLQELPHMVQSPAPTKARKGRARTNKAQGGGMEQATTVPAENSSGPGDAAQGGVDGVGIAAGVCTPMPQPRTGTNQVG
jgi:hypothetical protein